MDPTPPKGWSHWKEGEVRPAYRPPGTVVPPLEDPEAFRRRLASMRPGVIIERRALTEYEMWFEGLTSHGPVN